MCDGGHQPKNESIYQGSMHIPAASTNKLTEVFGVYGDAISANIKIAKRKFRKWDIFVDVSILTVICLS